MQIAVRHTFTVYEGKQSPAYMVCKYKLTEALPDLAEGSTITATGYALPSQKNAQITLNGDWEITDKYGRAFKVKSSKVEPPKTEEGIISYLCSLHIGIGLKKAQDVYRNFGDSTWKIIENEPEKLVSVKGISTAIVEKMKAEIERTKMVEVLMEKYQDCEAMTTARAARIVEMFKENTLKVLDENPYLLCKINGFTFETVDAIAKTDERWTPTSENRLECGVSVVFNYNASNGHTCIPTTQAVQDMKTLLKVDEASAKKGLNAAFKHAGCVVKDKFCYSAENYTTECSVAANIIRLLRSKSPFGVIEDKEIERNIVEFEKENGFEMAEQQKQAVLASFKNCFSIITGGPGTGKSTIIKAILYIAKKIKENPLIKLMAPTGRAARRMVETTGEQASTIHSALGIRFNENGDSRFGEMTETEPLDADIIVVDESSMIDQYLAKNLLSRIGSNTVCVFVGDSDQLPSVNAGNVLHEMIDSKLVPFTRLDVIFRQKDGNPIIVNSKKIITGDTNLVTNNEFIAYNSNDDQKTFDYTCKLYMRCVEKFGCENMMLLIPFRKKGLVCVDNFNKVIEEKMYERSGQTEKQILINGKHFAVGDKIMQTKNTDIAKNGDIGFIEKIEERPIPDEPFKKTLYVSILFEGEKAPIEYDEKAMRNIDLAYAQSIHKSQGSEATCVIVVMTKEHIEMAKRNLLYTAVTRAKKHVILVGDSSAFAHAIKNDKIDVRYTMLSKIIHELNEATPQNEDPRQNINKVACRS